MCSLCDTHTGCLVSPAWEGEGARALPETVLVLARRHNGRVKQAEIEACSGRSCCYDDTVLQNRY